MKMHMLRSIVGVVGVVLAIGACALFDDDPSPGEDQGNGNQVEQNAGSDNDVEPNQQEQNQGTNQGDDQNQDDENDGQNEGENGGGENDGEENNGEVTTNDEESDAAPRVRDMVTSADYDKMIIEIDYVAGQSTRDGVADRLVTALSEHIDKPAGLEVVIDEEVAETEPSGGWTFDELQDMVAEYRNLDVDANTTTAYTLLVDGEYADSDGTVLGIAWANRYVVLFLDQIEQACQGATIIPTMQEELCENAELTVWLHEMGHVLGLVDIGAPKQSEHADSDSSAHCDNNDCVMYWAFRRPQMMDGLVDRLLGSEPAVPQFDAACRADLEAVN